MIGDLSYNDFEVLEQTLEKENVILKELLKKFPSSTKMERFTEELDSYVAYLKTPLQLNMDADTALERIKELNK